MVSVAWTSNVVKLFHINDVGQVEDFLWQPFPSPAAGSLLAAPHDHNWNVHLSKNAAELNSIPPLKQAGDFNVVQRSLIKPFSCFLWNFVEAH